MAYIDFDYYNKVYIGEAVDEAVFPRYAQRASEAVDNITMHKVDERKIEVIDTFSKQQFKLAVAAQVEYYVLNGIDCATDGEVQAFAVGKVSISASKSKNVTPKVYEYLGPTGLLYRGL